MLSMTEPFLTAEINYRREKIRADFAGTASRRQLRQERRHRSQLRKERRRWSGQHLPVRATGPAFDK